MSEKVVIVGAEVDRIGKGVDGKICAYKINWAF